MEPVTNDEKQQKKDVQQAVELALIHRDIDDIRSEYKELKAGQENIEKHMNQLATQEDIKAIRQQLDQLMPWAQTLQTLEKLSKWLAAIAAGATVLIAAFSWFKGH